MGKNKHLKCEKNILTSMLFSGNCEDGKPAITISRNNLLPPLNFTSAVSESNYSTQEPVKKHQKLVHDISRLSLNVLDSRIGLLKNSNHNKKRYTEFCRPKSSFAAIAGESEEPEEIKPKLKYTRNILGRRSVSRQKYPSHYDMNLITKTPQTTDHKFKNIFDFIGKTKEELDAEKDARLEKMKKRKHDASTALMASLGHRIERYGKKILVGSKGVTASKR
mmetsp:Transcript_15772/g.18236  ORF Transcript_15772/g.18236 Transcript_15772/m.18236 type:complete len:221 (-) Transcript_15772:29-691(-)